MQIKYFKEKNYQLIIIYHLGQLENSIHIICDNSSKTAVVIDPAWDSNLFVNITDKLGYKITQIWLTHWHPDHTNAVDELANKTNAKILAGCDEIPYLSHIKNPIQGVYDAQIITIGNTKARVITTPGHSAGGVCFLLENRLIAGDTLFVYGAGHCALPGANTKQCFNSMQKLKQIPDDVYLHCGHDYGYKKTTTMGEQKTTNPFLLIDNLADFINYREQIHDNTRAYPMQKMTKKELLAIIRSK